MDEVRDFLIELGSSNGVKFKVEIYKNLIELTFEDVEMPEGLRILAHARALLYRTLAAKWPNLHMNKAFGKFQLDYKTCGLCKQEPPMDDGCMFCRRGPVLTSYPECCVDYRFASDFDQKCPRRGRDDPWCKPTKVMVPNMMLFSWDPLPNVERLGNHPHNAERRYYKRK